MFYNVLTAAVEATDYGSAFSGARWAEAGRMMLFGMVMIFAVLGLLWAILAVLKLFMVGKTPKTEKAAKPAPKPEKKREPEPVVAATSVADDNGELIAVLTAAVAAYMASEDPDAVSDGTFRVVSFKRVSGGRSWNTKR